MDFFPVKQHYIRWKVATNKKNSIESIVYKINLSVETDADTNKILEFTKCSQVFVEFQQLQQDKQQRNYGKIIGKRRKLFMWK